MGTGWPGFDGGHTRTGQAARMAVTTSAFPVIGFHQKMLVWTKIRRYIGAEVIRKTTGDEGTQHRAARFGSLAPGCLRPFPIS